MATRQLYIICKQHSARQLLLAVAAQRLVAGLWPEQGLLRRHLAATGRAHGGPDTFSRGRVCCSWSGIGGHRKCMDMAFHLKSINKCLIRNVLTIDQ